MRNLLHSLVGLWCILITIPVLAAQQVAAPIVTGVPRLIRVTGSLSRSSEVPSVAVEIVTFSIYAAETGGAPLWEETQSVAVGGNGAYTVLLGATTGDGLPLELFASGEAHWLGVRVEPVGGAEPPRVRLSSVPYALRAADADTLGGRPASDYLLASGGTGDAKSATVGTRSNVAGPTGTVNFVPKYVDSVNLGNSVLYDSGTQVGLGTTTPFDVFHVRFTNTGGNFTGLAVQNMGNTTTSYSGMLFYDQNNQLGQFQGFNNVTHEYRINNIGSGGSINFMLNSISKFQLRPDGDVDIAGGIRSGGAPFLYNSGIGSGFGSNTFLGLNAGNATMTGIGNTGIGFEVFQTNTTGAFNTAIGRRALETNKTGGYNSALGYHALDNSSGSSHNTAIGTQAMSANFGGDFNTAIGDSAMSVNTTTGDNNVAIGYLSGATPNLGSNNIYLGSSVSGVDGESNAMYLGLRGTQTKTVIAGIRGITTGINDAIPVMIDSNGQLGTISSSRRFKEDIHDMGEASRALFALRPVTFRYRQAYADGAKPIQYGLVAEEVALVFPELAVKNAQGSVDTVHYETLSVLLLNELQKQQQRIDALERQVQALIQPK